ncbi:MAG TPA: hypothetical protein DCX27_19645 [Balneola sp.]|nr:hypothetical protein [Balneola sp.]
MKQLMRSYDLNDDVIWDSICYNDNCAWENYGRTAYNEIQERVETVINPLSLIISDDIKSRARIVIVYRDK